MDGIRTPMVFGILRPQIYLPMEMKPEFYDCVLQHERIHLHRRDYLWKILTYLISIVHWMNPVVWLAYYLLCCDIEKACDEAVTEQSGAGGPTGICRRTAIHGNRYDRTQDICSTGVF